MSLTQQRKLKHVQRELTHWERQGIQSVAKMQAFVELAQHEGESLREVAGPAGGQRYNRLLQSMLDLGPGRAAKRATTKGAGLVTTKPSPGDGRSRMIALTSKGRRLLKRLMETF